MEAHTYRTISVLCRELEQLTGDLRFLKTVHAPAEEILRTSPLLDEWSFGFTPSPCLIGTIYGHPMLGNSRCVHTSELVLIDPGKRWARTWSKFYRLGRQLRTQEARTNVNL
jgi:hypothetical protein